MTTLPSLQKILGVICLAVLMLVSTLPAHAVEGPDQEAPAPRRVRMSPKEVPAKRWVVAALAFLITNGSAQCPPRLPGSSDCIFLDKGPDWCSYTCNREKESFVFPTDLIRNPDFYVETILEKVHPLCDKSYKEMQNDLLNVKEKLKKLKKEVAIHEQEQRNHEKAISNREHDFLRFSPIRGVCPPVKEDGLLPLLGSASKTCRQTKLTQQGLKCTYRTNCTRLPYMGPAVSNPVIVFASAPDCNVDGNSMSRFENCDGTLKPRAPEERDDQCANPGFRNESPIASKEL